MRAPCREEPISFIFPTVLSAFAAAVVFTWLVRKAATAWGVLDHPDGNRKVHRFPVPLFGGVGVLGAWSSGMIIRLVYHPETAPMDDAASLKVESRLSFTGGFGSSH